MKQHRRVKTRAMLRRASVVHIEPGDLVVLRLQSEPSFEECERARSTLRSMCVFAEAEILVVGPGTSLQVIRERERGAA